MTRALILLCALASPTLAEPFDESALLAAAQKEPALTVIDSTGKVREQVAGFAAKYGLQANGTKSEAPGTIRRIMAEAQAGNVQADVLGRFLAHGEDATAGGIDPPERAAQVNRLAGDHPHGCCALVD